MRTLEQRGHARPSPVVVVASAEGGGGDERGGEQLVAVCGRSESGAVNQSYNGEGKSILSSSRSSEGTRMVRKISVQEAASNFVNVLGSISDVNEIVIVDDTGASVAIVMSPEAFLSFRRERAWALVRQVQDRNADQDPEEVLREVTEIVEEVRQEQYDRQRAALAGSS
jgi:hypothetical protein